MALSVDVVGGTKGDVHVVVEAPELLMKTPFPVATERLLGLPGSMAMARTDGGIFKVMSDQVLPPLVVTYKWPLPFTA